VLSAAEFDACGGTLASIEERIFESRGLNSAGAAFKFQQIGVELLFSVL
jgi:hypothetical protein